MVDSSMDVPQPLSVGAVIEPSPNNRQWQDAIRELTISIDDAQRGVDTPLNLNVVFHVPGRTYKPEFAGVRTGRFSKRDTELMVQVALPETVPADPVSFLRAAMVEAIDAAERWAVSRKIATDLGVLRTVVAAS